MAFLSDGTRSQLFTIKYYFKYIIYLIIRQIMNIVEYFGADQLNFMCFFLKAHA
jgi:hypothetical protein